VGTVSFVGIELPVGELVLALRALWPSWHTRYVITGSLQRCLSGSATRGQLVARLEEDGRTRKHWSYELPLNNEMLALLWKAGDNPCCLEEGLRVPTLLEGAKPFSYMMVIASS
jgi:hypothetical protein